METDLRRRHAERMRRYRARMKEHRTPGKQDLAHALLEAAQACFAKHRLTPAEQEIWTALIEGTLDRLDARGFDRKEAKRRLLLALDPRNLRR